MSGSDRKKLKKWMENRGKRLTVEATAGRLGSKHYRVIQAWREYTKELFSGTRN
jgi:hypothetical protein